MKEGVCASVQTPSSVKGRPLREDGSMSKRDPFLYSDGVPANLHVFGSPGGSLNSSGFDAGSTNAGIDGERRVAAVLDEYAKKNRNVYAFHSVKLPGHFGDIDHVLLVGGTVVVIDSKNWRSDSSYSVAGDGETILRDGDLFPGGKVALTRYIGEMTTYLRASSVVGVLAVANSRSSTSVPKGNPWDFLNLIGLKKRIHEIVGKEGKKAVPSRSVSLLAERVVNPDFEGDWDEVVHGERAHGGSTTASKSPRVQPSLKERVLDVLYYPALALALLTFVAGVSSALAPIFGLSPFLSVPVILLAAVPLIIYGLVSRGAVGRGGKVSALAVLCCLTPLLSLLIPA